MLNLGNILNEKNILDSEEITLLRTLYYKNNLNIGVRNYIAEELQSFQKINES